MPPEQNEPASPGETSSANGKASSTRNVLPLLTRLPTVSVPPMSSTSRLLMASPSPVPPKRRVADSSTCMNGLKMRPISDSGMPMPQSRTTNSSRTRVLVESTTRTRRLTDPSSVNFTALLHRLRRTCRTRRASPISSKGTSGAISKENSSPFPSASGSTTAARIPSSFLRLKGVRANSSLLASTLVRSRISLRMPSKAVLDSLIREMYSYCCVVKSVFKAR